ncbi:MAG: glycyl-radical enzyme activating protein [Bacteroidales bacterium]|nr:glycyl-radical enzyme activating protein [Bacteroidales bacterium]MCF8404400.1 glycyl-radical enzyme activating protein [Bacteroidales bacterium]
MTVEGKIFNIQRFSIHDGPGIRTTVFLQGCPLSCKWCHNPEGRTSGIRLDGVEVGKEYTADKLLDILLKDRIFYDESGGGVTFSGGEPLSQPGFLKEILVKCREQGLHTAVDTTGYTVNATLESIVPFTDIFLYDIKFIDPILHKRFTGVSNESILRNFDFLINHNVEILIRIPLIPGITANTDNIKHIKEFLDRFNKVFNVTLLPYHTIAEGKYNKFGITNEMQGVEKITENEINRLAGIFPKDKFHIKINGLN